MKTFELRVINPATGTGDWVLGDVETWQVSPVISDAGTVQFTYPNNGANYSQVIMDRDIAVYYGGVEIGWLRSTMEQRSWNDVDPAEEGAIATITCRTSMARMERAIVYPQGWPTNNNPPSYTFTAKTPGYIIRVLVQLAQTRGTIPEIDISSFSDTLDSNGVAWTSSISLSWNAQTTILQVIQDLQTYGQCDALMNVYSLKLYNYQTSGVDRTTQNPPVIIRKGRDLTQSTVQESTRALRTVTLMSGSNNLYTESSYSPGVSAYGRRETGSSASGVTNSTQLTTLGNQLSQATSADIIGRTNALVMDNPNSPVPSVDFNLGDWVFTEIDGVQHRQRILQYSVACDKVGTITGTTALDTIFGEFLTRLQAQVNAIENGATITGGSQPNKVTVITSPPAVPTSVSAGTTAYVDNQGHTLASLSIVWAQVLLDQTGAADPNIAGYQIRVKAHTATVWTLFSCDANTLNYYVGALPPATQYDYEVQCYDNQANYSGWSSIQTITTASDTTPPNTPSTPTVASTLGQLSITWDGKDNLAGNMPGDFDHLSVYVSSLSPTFTPSAANLYQNMRGGGTVTVPGTVLSYGTTYYVRFIAYDQSGNASTASAAGSATLSQVVSTDIGTGQVGLGNLSFSDVGNLVDNGSFEDPNWRTTRNTQFGGTHFSFDNTTSSAGNWSVIHTGTGGQTSETVVLNTINCTAGQTFMGAADWKINSATTSSAMRVAVGVVFRDVNGTSLGYSDLSFCWTSPSTNDNTWRSRIFTQPVSAPSGAVTAQFVLVSSNHTAGSVWADNVEVRMQQDNFLIANAAITNAKINDMSANKITAGTISAGVILSGSIGTAASGQRCVMDGTGYHAYDSGGNLMFDVNNFNSVLTLGAVSAAFKIQMDMSGVYPTIRFYDTSNSNNSFMNVTNSDSNTGAFGINGGQYTFSSVVMRNRLLLWGPSVGGQIHCMDDSTQATDGGIMYVRPQSALLGLFPQSATHGGQLLMAYNSGNGDCSVELDGYRTNNGGTAPQVQENVFGGEIGSLSGAGVSWGYGVTMFSNVTAVAVPRDINTSPIPSFMMTTNSTTGFGLIASASYTGLFSVMFWAMRNR